nr:MAG TPA: hypothetical protein [Caudoviricetes sp.]
MSNRPVLLWYCGSLVLLVILFVELRKWGSFLF